MTTSQSTDIVKPKTDKPLSTSSAIFKWRSLKTRVTLTTLAFFVIGIWSLVIFTSYMLKKDMEQALGEQQFSTVSIIAAEINTGLSDRMSALEQVASLITPTMMGNAASMQTFIEGRPAFSTMFNGGVFVLLHDGTAIADFPLSTGRRGLNFIDRKYAIGALKEGKTTIGRPVMGKALRSTVFSIATPIHDAQGKVIGALSGTVDLAKPNFISRIADNSYGKTGGYLLVSPKIRTIVYATDKKRIMEVLPPPGVNPLIDRFIQGHDGTGITIKPNDGVEILTSAKSIPVSGWYAVALMPTEEAFSPITALQKRGLLAAIFLTLLAGGLTWWMLKRQLSPIFTTIKTLATLSDTDQFTQPLNITRQDEIGEMIGSFNHLLETLGKREEALRESEAHYRSLVEGMPGIVYTYSKKRGGVYYSSNITSLLGYSPEQLYVQPQLWHNSIHPDDLSYIEQIIRETATGKPFCVEYRIRDAHGNWRLFEDRSFGFKVDGEDAIIEGLAFDITDRKLAEKALHHVKQDWEQTFDAVPDLISIIDTSHNIIRVNRAMADRCGLGLTPEELIGRKCHEIMHGTPDMHSSCPHLKMMQDGFGHFEQVEEKRLNRVFDVTVSPLYNTEGQLSACVHVARDVTERKRAEEERLAIEAQFQQTQKLESLGVLAGGIAHDFNNILTIILGHCYIIDSDFDTKMDQKGRVKEIEKAAQRAADLCHQMLSYGGKNALIQTRINLWLMVDENVKMLTSALKKNVLIELDLKYAVPEINGDSAQIQQVVMNLIINAAEAIGEKNGTIRIALKKAIIPDDQVETDFLGNRIPPGSYAYMEVADNGCGMDAETQKRIFEPFFTTKFTGRGLGMSAVLGIIKSHEGVMQLASTPGVGTTFKVYFPSYNKTNLVETAQTAESVPLTKASGTILLVDDEKSIRIIGSALLKSIGFSVMTATNGREALDIYREHGSGIDMVLLDLLMPEMGGFETYHTLREISHAIPVVIFSGCSAEEIQEKIINDEHAAVIQKPFKPDQLRNTLMKLLKTGFE